MTINNISFFHCSLEVPSKGTIELFLVQVQNINFNLDSLDLTKLSQKNKN